MSNLEAGSDIQDVIHVLTQEWSYLKDPKSARGKCTEYISTLRYVLDYIGIPYTMHRAEIYFSGILLGSHDFVMVDGKVVDFTLSQFPELGLPWPYHGPLTEFHKRVTPVSLMNDPQDAKRAMDIVAESEEWEIKNLH